MSKNFFNWSICSRPSSRKEPSSRSKTRGSDCDSSKNISPTMVSKISFDVTNPSMPPYSSITSAMCVRSRLNTSNVLSVEKFSGTNKAGCTCARRSNEVSVPFNASSSVASKMPMTLSRSPSATGKCECLLFTIAVRISESESATSSQTICERGVMTILTRRSSKLRTPSIMSCSVSSNTPICVPCSTRLLTSSSVTAGSEGA